MDHYVSTLRHWMFVALVLLMGCERSPEQNAAREADAFLQDNHLQAAMETVESCLTQHPNSRELLRLRVLILLKAERFDAVMMALRSLPKDDPVLAQALRHRDPLVRSGAARLIAEQSISIDCRNLIRGLDDSMPTVRQYCARALGQKHRGCAAVKPIFRLLHDDTWFVRAEAAKALGEIGDPRAAGWLVFLLNDADGFVRFAAATALRQVASPANRELLMKEYHRAGNLQQLDLAVALAKLKEPSVLGSLTDAVNSQEADYRRRAAEALADYPPGDVTNALARLMSDPNPAVKEQAAVSLRKVSRHTSPSDANP